MKPNDEAIEAALLAAKTVLRNDEITIDSAIFAALDAAYAAQFKSDDYAGLVKELRAFDEELLNAQPHSCEQTAKHAADALEAALADRDALMAVNAEFSVVFKERDDAIAERDALAARLAPVEAIETDKDDPTREYIPLPGGWEIQTKGKGSSYRLLDKKTGERHMILASDVPFIHAFVTRMAKEINASAQVQPVAPVDDEALINIAADKMRECGALAFVPAAIVLAIRPHIEAAERERCAKIASGLCESCGGEGWLWAHELGIGLRNDDTKYSCDGQGESIACKIAEAIRRSGK